jgi:hypothetical protein
MVRRKLIPVIVAGALVLPVTLLGGFRAAPPPAHAAPQSASLDGVAPTGEAEVLVQWIIRTEDLLACRTVTPDLRRMQHQHGDRLRVVAYPVASDTALVRSFLRRERLGRVEVQPITMREFQREFAHRLEQPARLPSLIVLTRGSQVASFDAGLRAAPSRRGVNEFASYLGDILDGISVANNGNVQIAAGGE